MSPSLSTPTRAGSVGGRARASTSVAILIVLLVVLGGLSSLAVAPHVSSPATGSTQAVPAAEPPYTHGDLNVTAGEVFTIQPTAISHTYYQGGNITVFAGGTLIVRNVTLSFVQFVSDVGVPIQRLSHIYRFVDEAGGAVHFYNATLTTDVDLLNAWAKLNFTVEGTVTAQNSTFAFPGWLNVEGASGALTLNGSRMTGNPAVTKLLEPSTILGDTEYAASIAVTGGAQMNVFNSTLNRTYADDTLTNGHPQPIPLFLPDNPSQTPLPVGVSAFYDLPTPTDSANLTQDYLYPNAVFQAGNLIGNYTNDNKTIPADVSLSVWYGGTNYLVASVVWLNQTSGSFDYALPPALLDAITNDGMLNYLNWTGDFGVTPSKIAIQFDVTSGPPSHLGADAEISLLPTPSYNLVVTGPGSTFNVADSSLGLNFNNLPANATSQAIPYPWNSNKLLLTDGATGYFANVTVAEGVPGVFSRSAVLPDATSEAFFYRLAQFNITGLGGALPIPNADVSAYYAYSTDQSDNQTTNALNDLAVANPQIWGYVQYFDQLQGVPAYGVSNVVGHAFLFLASTNITGLTLPDGYFLGGYHLRVYVPIAGVGVHWFNWTVSPYPGGVGQAPPALAGPDFAPNQNFPGYFGGVEISSLTVLANGVASTNINFGQTVSVHLVVEDTGTAPVIQLQGLLSYAEAVPPGIPLASYTNTTIDLTAPGQTTSFTLSWVANANVTDFKSGFQHNLTVFLSWNHNNATLAGGNITLNESVTFLSTQVVVTATTLANGVPSGTIYLGELLTVQVVVTDVGNATINQVALDLYYNTTYVLASASSTTLHLTTPGQQVTFDLTWTATEKVTGQNALFAHDLTLTAAWNANYIWLGNGTMTQSVPLTFAPTVASASPTLLANGVASPSVSLGQELGVQVLVTDVGNGTIASLSAWLYYNKTAVLATYTNTAVGLSKDGTTFQFTMTWKSSENITGLHGWFNHNLSLVIEWNNLTVNTWLGVGSNAQNVSVYFEPSQIRFTSFSLPPSTLNLGTAYTSSASLEFNGSGFASVQLIATPVGGGGIPLQIAATPARNGSFIMDWFDLGTILSPGTTYTLTANATYNIRGTNDVLAGTFTVPSPSSSSSNFFTQKVLGLPLWVWLAIAAAAAVGIVLFLFVVRRQAVGKLVECGECGNLIPEDATTCPKCGAEFETDLLRCSRCASTIPANSKFCPECAAQLLGTPGEEKSDPEKQAYADFTEKYRAEAKRELGDNYSEGAFWDWWKRQPTYTPFSQWSLQQGQGVSRAGMTAPPTGTETTEEELPKPPKGGAGAPAGWTEPTAAAGAKPAASAPLPTTTTVPPPAAGGAGLKPCPSCGKEIPAEYLVCPFCNAVTQ